MNVFAERNLLLAAELEKGLPQVRGVLKSDDGYCCLGIACEVFLRETGEGSWSETALTHGHCSAFEVNGIGNLLTPPWAVWKWYGWKTNNPEITVNGNEELAAVLNDAKRLSFAEIATGFRALAAELEASEQQQKEGAD